MKLSTYAKQLGLSYKTAYRMWKEGKLDAYQLPTGIIILRDDGKRPEQKVVLSARCSSAGPKEDAARQLERLRFYAAAKGYKVAKEVLEIASDLNDQRPKLDALLKDRSITTIVVEHKDRLTRFGFHYIQSLLETTQRTIEVMNESVTKDDLVDDFVAVITSMCARIYGKRAAKNKVACIKTCLDLPDTADEQEESE